MPLLAVGLWICPDSKRPFRVRVTVLPNVPGMELDGGWDQHPRAGIYSPIHTGSSLEGHKWSELRIEGHSVLHRS